MLRGGTRAVLLALTIAVLLFGSLASGQCTGDCDGDRTVSVGELTSGVRLSLGETAQPPCLPAFDIDGAGAVGINELVRGVENALAGCVGCPSLNVAFPPCTMPNASALCYPDGGVTLGGLRMENDGRFLRIEVLGLESGLTYFATAGSTWTARINGVAASRFGIVEPASGDVRARDFRDNQSVLLANLVPTLRIGECRVRQLYGSH